MDDTERAEQALAELRAITATEDIVDERDAAIAAVVRLVDALEAAAEEELAVDTPEEWADEDDEWDERLEDAYEQAEIARSTGTLTTKTIDGREYYYLQWREGDKVTSQYVAPVEPA